MRFQFSIFIVVSCLAHASLLFVPDRSAPPLLQIGGYAESLRVTLLSPPAPTSAGTELAVVETAQPPARPSARSQHAPQQPTAQPTPPPSVLVKSVVTPASRPAPTATPDKADNRTAAPAPARATPRVSSPGLSDRVSAALQSQLAEHFEYPWLARKRGWQGLVTLSLHIDAHGTVSQWRVSRTSGHTVLDRSALEAARGIDRLQQSDSLLNGESLNLSIPVHYRLVDS